MSKHPAAVIINPRSGGGRTGRQWPRLEPKLVTALGQVSCTFTEKPGDATRLTRKALKDGCDLVIAVGGDGTINEVVNGFFDNGTAINEDASLSLIPAATGGDFRRTFGFAGNPARAIEQIQHGTPHAIDLGRMTYLDQEGNETTRYFANTASFGLSGVVSRAVNDAGVAKLFGGQFAFLWCSLRHAFSYKNRTVELIIDGGPAETLRVSTVCLCNGQYFGGGMHIAPDARPDDGQFDLVIFGDIGMRDVLSNIHRLYKGSLGDNPKVTIRHARTVQASNEGDPIFLEMDGETPGRLPAVFEIVPRALKLVF